MPSADVAELRTLTAGLMRHDLRFWGGAQGQGSVHIPEVNSLPGRCQEGGCLRHTLHSRCHSATAMSDTHCVPSTLLGTGEMEVTIAPGELAVRWGQRNYHLNMES